MDIQAQINSGKLRCVRTGGTLRLENGALTCGSHRYAMAGGKVPVILKNEADAQAMLKDNPEMEREYTHPGLYRRIRQFLYRDYNSKVFKELMRTIVSDRPANELVISIGGGPTRDGANSTNLNIGPFPNVDIVGDAHDLPYNDNVADAIFCSAVLEHVKEPIRAVREMYRVLKPGGKVLSCIPFLQAYHGYPNHFQNYTLTGHEYLYSSNGFRVIESGACQGPVMALTTLTSRFFLEYLPRPLNIIVGRGIQGISLLLRPLDILLEKHPQRYVVASATHVLAEKI